jgi:hypothetical protein
MIKSELGAAGIPVEWQFLRDQLLLLRCAFEVLRQLRRLPACHPEAKARQGGASSGGGGE